MMVAVDESTTDCDGDGDGGSKLAPGRARLKISL